MRILIETGVTHINTKASVFQMDRECENLYTRLEGMQVHIVFPQTFFKVKMLRLL